MMSKFTKGPWRIGGEGQDGQLVISPATGKVIVCLKDKIFVRNEQTESFIQEEYANARLIAKSPESYDRLMRDKLLFHRLIDYFLKHGIYGDGSDKIYQSLLDGEREITELLASIDGGE
jgi:hypothetical protein